MESLYLLVPVALIFIVIAVRVLFWAVNSGQYDDLNTEGQRILFDDDAAAPPQRPAAPDSTTAAPAPRARSADNSAAK